MGPLNVRGARIIIDVRSTAADPVKTRHTLYCYSSSAAQSDKLEEKKTPRYTQYYETLHLASIDAIFLRQPGCTE